MLTRSQYDLLLPYRNHPQRFDNGLPDTHSHLEDLGFISATGFDSSAVQIAFPVEWSITPAGLAALEQFEEMLQKEADQKRQQRFQNKMSVASVLVPLITFFLGLIVEHYVGLVNLFRKIFQ